MADSCLLDRMSASQFNKLIASGSKLESSLMYQLVAAQIPPPVREYRFNSVRKWRLDLAWPGRMIAAEIEGGTYRRSRHTSADGFYKDCEKYNSASLMGWQLFRFDSKMVNNGEALFCLQTAFGVHALEWNGMT